MFPTNIGMRRALKSDLKSTIMAISEKMMIIFGQLDAEFTKVNQL
jgi:hypothetical protein